MFTWDEPKKKSQRPLSITKGPGVNCSILGVHVTLANHLCNHINSPILVLKLKYFTPCSCRWTLLFQKGTESEKGNKQRGKEEEKSASTASPSP